MTALDAFAASVTADAPPAGSGPALQALWWARRGDWAQAHECVQAHEGEPDCDSVHAHLHRQEGDLANAGYWYRRAGRPVSQQPLDAEWAALAAELLARA
ncbi:MAG: hypothetical protein B7Y08_24835 [Rhodospirillales bacterium 24-66-33]|jgi:hypothetical protein|uniref:hypothetical protein n=1 Tax=Reyranella sp. TaxID=1929291 RepID=UPI000BD4833B|nr:hypothetical protein [Reyranella sp.]OYY36760.1 MAG: hypothetical protein B7Y57_23945 [Rhodospirillales bacterium 35-66-84]OYZ91721.1 MAG: hypothetical protein B7Y08_24835 [Rhodospirillales bacterium 24-66-33]OZB22768.1 MAG: hypothetical protein B7X63_21985 [Rhodospirillales bacterium 39-66-50]HQS19076.1 hypothetical protein [Reyranella sp.]HQT09967.1 hypothetical protein [Reyranella sp.]